VLVEKFSTGSAKNARYASECPSSSSNRGRAPAASDAGSEVSVSIESVALVTVTESRRTL
jgi:hypothetical protein